VRLPFALEGAGSGRVSVANVRITREAKAGLLHPNEKGYAIWQRAMASTLQTLLAGRP
jgi:lysophospholipase L1-like esterase